MQYVLHESSGSEHASLRNIAAVLSLKDTVLLVSRPHTWRPWRQSWPHARIRHLQPMLTALTPVAIPGFWGASRLTNFLNAGLWEDTLRKSLKNTSPHCIIFDNPSQLWTFRSPSACATGYYPPPDGPVDNMGRRSQRMDNLEKTVFSSVDVVFVSSQLQMSNAQRSANKVVYLPPAYNSEYFDGATCFREPPCMASIPKPRILICGTIDDRFDLTTVAQLARERPKWQFIFLGPCSDFDDPRPATRTAGTSRNWLWRLNNVHYLGNAPFALVPAIMAACDVGFLPLCTQPPSFPIPPHTVLEFLALGKPVVTTLPPECDEIRHNVILAQHRTEYPAALQSALGTKDDLHLVSRRNKSVASHTFATRASDIEKAMTEACNHRS